MDIDNYLDLNKEFASITGSYEIIQLLGTGSYGVVVKAQNKETKKIVAIKKFFSVYRDMVDAKRILREIAIIRKLNATKHPNIIEIYDLIIPDQQKVNEIFLVMEFCEMDLSKFIESGYQMSPLMIKKIILDILQGLHYMNKRGVIHRDIKPANILINIRPNVTAKLCDFGLSREMTLNFQTDELLNIFLSGIAHGQVYNEDGKNMIEIQDGVTHGNLSKDLFDYVQKKLNEISYKLICQQASGNGKKLAVNFVQKCLYNEMNIKNYYDLYKLYKDEDMKLRRNLTPHVITRAYRPPEILLVESIYSNTVDIWSCGCILGEMLLSTLKEYHPMFNGKYSCFLSPLGETFNETEQMMVILQGIGAVTLEDMSFITNESKKNFLQYINDIINKKRICVYRNKFKNCDPTLVSLLQEMLRFNPIKRANIESAITYLGGKVDAKSYDPIINIWEEENSWTEEKMKQYLLYELNEYKVQNLANDIGDLCSLAEVKKSAPSKIRISRK